MRLERDLTCVELVVLVTAYLEGALAASDAERFEEHLTLCPACVAHFEQMRATIEVTGRLRGEDLDAELTGALLAAFRGWRPKPV
jgi:anti-sigma factor RsiW